MMSVVHVFILFCLFNVSTCADIYVSMNGTDDTTCGSFGQPCQTIQYAINLSNNGDTISVSPGTYSNSFLTFNYKNIILVYLFFFVPPKNCFYSIFNKSKFKSGDNATIDCGSVNDTIREASDIFFSNQTTQTIVNNFNFQNCGIFFNETASPILSNIIYTTNTHHNNVINITDQSRPSFQNCTFQNGESVTNLMIISNSSATVCF